MRHGDASTAKVSSDYQPMNSLLTTSPLDLIPPFHSRSLREPARVKRRIIAVKTLLGIQRVSPYFGEALIQRKATACQRKTSGQRRVQTNRAKRPRNDSILESFPVSGRRAVPRFLGFSEEGEPEILVAPDRSPGTSAKTESAKLNCGSVQ